MADFNNYTPYRPNLLDGLVQELGFDIPDAAATRAFPSTPRTSASQAAPLYSTYQPGYQPAGLGISGYGEGYLQPRRSLVKAQPSARALPQVAQARPSTKVTTKVPTKPVQSEPERHIAGTLADYDSLLFRKPEVVMGWLSAPFKYTHAQVTRVLQYFEQVSQTKSQARVDEILQLRRPEILNQQLWHLLDPLDPLVRCPPIHDHTRGVPQVGTILGQRVGDNTDEPIEGNRPDISIHDQNTKMKRGEQSYQLRPYRWHWQCLPIDATCWDILQYYPNHTAHEFLDAFLQHQMRPTDMWQAMDKDAQRRFKEQGVVQTDQDGNLFTKRQYRRMLVLIEKAGGDHKKVEAFLKSPIKLRRLGGNLSGTDKTNCNVWHVKQKWDRAVRKRDEYQTSLQLEGQPTATRS